MRFPTPARSAAKALVAASLALCLPGPALAASLKPPPPADPLTVRIHTEDAERFARVFAASGGKPTAEQLQKGYLDPGSYGVAVFTPMRIEDAATLAKAVADDPATYERAIRDCLPRIKQQEAELRAIYLALHGLLPDKPLPQIYVVFGAGDSGGTAGPGAQVIGLEVICALDPSPEGLRANLRTFFAHETFHTIQHKPALAGKSPLLAAALKEGAADFIAWIVTGEVPNPPRAQWAAVREAELWDQFRKDVAATQPAARKAAPDAASQASRRWIGNYKRAPLNWPHEVGYWIGMRIWQSYYDTARDKHAVIRDAVAWDDPDIILRKSGYAGGARSGETPQADRHAIE